LNHVVETLRNYWLIALVSTVLAALTVDFIFRFLLPASGLLRSLRMIRDTLREANAVSVKDTGDLDAMIGGAKLEPAFAALWLEYSKTLHPQRGTDDVGHQRILHWRATALAETFFTDQALVDSPLGTEYFKHLPGILTGLGIIGTFGGLIKGLSQFKADAKPEQVQASLNDLIRAVGHAFIVSATAILLAMVFTWIEKFLLNKCYAIVEDIQQAVDGLFHAGVGEEYLERLVKASETSATQALHIKDALVADLKQILTEITAQQVEASARDSSQISTDVGKVIADSLGGPMERISVAVERVGSTQGDAINTMLVDVLARFSEQMKEMFGGQMQGMSDLLTQTTQAMQTTASKFEQLATNMDSAGKSAADAMAERLSGAVTSMEARQQVLNRQMSEFVEQIKALVSQSQTETGEKLQQVLSKLGEQVVSVVGQLQEQARNSSERQYEQGSRFADQTGQAVTGLSREVENLVRQSVEINRSLQGSVTVLTEATSDSISRMNAGAELLFIASSDFAKAGEGVTDSLKGSSGAIEKIQAATSSLGNAMKDSMEILDDYRKNRDAFAMMVADLKTTVQNAKKEAFMTSDIVEKLQAAASQLSNAEKQSEEYLKGISDVLTKAHETFAANVEKTLHRGNTQFHVELSNAVNLLSAGVQDLGDMLENVSAKR
jgi:methyl-accepting chemotaxis protein